MLAQNAALALAFAPLRLSVSAKKANQSFINQKKTEAPFEEPLLFYGISPKTWLTVGARVPLPYMGGEFNADCLQLGFSTDPFYA